MLAERLPTILPPLEVAAAIEVTSIHSVAGHLAPGSGLVTVPPFCAPHHTASMASIVGGGSGVIRPGAASLAHLGILFLDEAPEFHRDVLDALRQPLESGQVVIARARLAGGLPRPVHPGAGGQPVPVREERRAGQGRVHLLPGRAPPLPRPDLRAAAGPGRRQGPPPAGLPPRTCSTTAGSPRPSAVVAQRVAAARERCSGPAGRDTVAG